jgi:hypothetical protein
LLRSGAEIWNFVPPSGGASSPYRLGDFRGYSHNASPPFFIPPLAAKYFYYGTGSVIAVSVNETLTQTGELSLSDIGYSPNMREMYACAAIAKQGEGIIQYVTESVTIANGGGGGVEIPMGNITGFANGKYEVAMLLSSNPKTSFTAADVANTFVPLMGGYSIIEIVTSTISAFIEGEKAGNDVNWRLILTNYSSSALTLNGCTVFVRYADNDINDPMQAGEYSTTIGTVTVPANGSLTKTGTFTNAITQLNRQGRVWFRNTTNTGWNNDSWLNDIE